jgi:hypothetical protein
MEIDTQVIPPIRKATQIFLSSIKPSLVTFSLVRVLSATAFFLEKPITGPLLVSSVTPCSPGSPPL